MITMTEWLMSLEMGLIYGVVSLGVYLTFRVIDYPDLTCDGSFVLGAAVSSIAIQADMNPWLALLLSIAAGAFAGWSTGMLHLKNKISPMLSGILVGFMLYSINLRIMGGLPNISLINNITIFSERTLAPLFVISFLSCIAIIVLLLTDQGLALRSIGQNKKLAQYNGVSLTHMTLLGLSLSNALIALGGALFSQHEGFADIGSGLGTIIIGLTSVMIGEKCLPSRSIFIQVTRCFLGSLLYRIFIGISLHADFLGLNTSDLNFITGLIVIGIMRLPQRRSPC